MEVIEARVQCGTLQIDDAELGRTRQPAVVRTHKTQGAVWTALILLVSTAPRRHASVRRSAPRAPTVEATMAAESTPPIQTDIGP